MSRPQKAHDQLGVRLRPSSPNRSLGDGERQHTAATVERRARARISMASLDLGLGAVVDKMWASARRSGSKAPFSSQTEADRTTLTARRGAMVFFFSFDAFRSIYLQGWRLRTASGREIEPNPRPPAHSTPLSCVGLETSSRGVSCYQGLSDRYEMPAAALSGPIKARRPASVRSP